MKKSDIKGLNLMPGLSLPPAPADPNAPEEHEAISPGSKSLGQFRQFNETVVHENLLNVVNSTGNLATSYRTLFWMYVVLFGVGILTAAAAIWSGIFQSNQAASSHVATVASFAGLSAGSFVTLFLIRPLESLERDSIYGTWMTVALNTYWTRLMYFHDQTTIDRDLKAATDDLVAELSTLADKHATAIGKYPALANAETQTTAPPKIVSVKDSTGSAAGGTDVVISGSGFLSGATVTFAGVLGTKVSVVDDGTIKCTTPAHLAGPADVVVTNSGQAPDKASTMLAQAFTYS